MRRNAWRRLLLCVVIALSYPAVSIAEEIKSEIKAVVESRYIGESDVEAQSGDVSISESKFWVGREYKLDNGLPISFSISGKHTDINSDVAVFLPSQLVAATLGVGVKFPVPFVESENYFMGIDVMPSMFTDGWDEFSSDAFRVPSRVYLIYKRDDNFILVGGLSIRPDFDTKVLPLIGFVYKPNASWEIDVTSDNPHVMYHWTEKTKLLLEADIINDEYEVTRNGEEGRVLFYKELSAGVGVRHEFTKNCWGFVSVGSVFSRMIRYEDDQGKVEPDAGLYVKARFSLNF